MSEFYQTLMGRKFFEADVPRIAKALEKIGEELDRSNTEGALAKDVGPSKFQQQDFEDGDRVRRWCDIEECEERAVLHRCKHHGKSFVELVWIVTELDTRILVDSLSVRASEQSARDFVRDRIKDDGGLMMVVKNTMLHDLDQWDGQSNVTIGAFSIRCCGVNL